MEKLNELSLNWHYPHYGTLSIGLPVHLTEFECVIACQVPQQFASYFIRNILNSSPRLRSLTILKDPGIRECPVDFNTSCFRALADSRLETIYLDLFSSESLGYLFLEKGLHQSWKIF